MRLSAFVSGTSLTVTTIFKDALQSRQYYPGKPFMLAAKPSRILCFQDPTSPFPRPAHNRDASPPAEPSAPTSRSAATRRRRLRAWARSRRRGNADGEPRESAAGGSGGLAPRINGMTETRTRTSFRAADFKSAVSTDSTIIPEPRALLQGRSKIIQARAASPAGTRGADRSFRSRPPRSPRARAPRRRSVRPPGKMSARCGIIPGSALRSSSDASSMRASQASIAARVSR